ncbi:hypothetical protein QUB59_12390 [Microcoleus sp. A2-D5]
MAVGSWQLAVRRKKEGFPHLPISPSPHLPLSPSPHLPISPSPHLPLSPSPTLWQNS